MRIPVPITNERGETLLRVHAPEQPDGGAPAPVAAALVLAHHEQGVMLIHNRRRRVWELPGGFLDPGESPMQGAIRELREEAGCEVADVSLLAILEIDRPHAARAAEKRLWCALFGGRVVARSAPQDDGEVEAVACWTSGSLLSPISAIDAALLAAYAASES